MARPAYAVRRVDAADARDVAVALWRKNRAPTDREQLVYRWYYERNALPPAHVFLVEQDGEPVGMTGVARRTLRTQDGTLSAALLGDFVIDKRHRTLMPAMMLQRAVLEWARSRFDLIYGFPNAAAQPVMKRLGYRDLGRMTRFSLVLRHARHVQKLVAGRVAHLPTPMRRTLESRIVARVLAEPLDAWARIGRGRFWMPDGTHLRRVNHPHERFDARFSRVTLGCEIIAQRDADFLRWRFLARPDHPCSLWTLQLGDAVLAYAVVHADGSVAHVRDVFGESVELIGELLIALGDRMRADKMATLSLLASEGPLTTHLESVGFVRRDTGHPIIGLAGDSQRFSASAAWFLTEADEDQ